MKNDAAARLAELNELNQKSRETEIRLRATLENNKSALETAKKDAKERFGTDNIEELREKYRVGQAEDMRAIEEFEKSVNLRLSILEEIGSSLEKLNIR